MKKIALGLSAIALAFLISIVKYVNVYNEVKESGKVTENESVDISQGVTMEDLPLLNTVSAQDIIDVETEFDQYKAVKLSTGAEWMDVDSSFLKDDTKTELRRTLYGLELIAIRLAQLNLSHEDFLGVIRQRANAIRTSPTLFISRCVSHRKWSGQADGWSNSFWGYDQAPVEAALNQHDVLLQDLKNRNDTLLMNKFYLYGIEKSTLSQLTADETLVEQFNSWYATQTPNPAGKGVAFLLYYRV